MTDAAMASSTPAAIASVDASVDSSTSSVDGNPIAAFDVKGTVSSLTVLRLRTADLLRIEAELEARVAPHPQIFLHAPVIIDVAQLDGLRVDWERLVRALRATRLVPVGVANTRGAETDRAVSSGLGIMQLGSRLRSVEPDLPVSESTPPTAAPPTAAATAAPVVREPMTTNQPVRGGQVVYARGTDLVVSSSVNPGAQVIADGSVHIWGTLRGRALAGAQGKADARIFCLSLDAELVSINGEYVMADEIPDALRGKPAQILLDCGRVKIVPL